MIVTAKLEPDGKSKIESQVETQMASIEIVTDNLFQSIKQLETRLNGVLTDPGPDKEDEERPEELLVELAGVLKQRNKTLFMTHKIVESILDRLEL